MQGSASRPGHPALREGLVFGVILGIITLSADPLRNFVVSDILGNILAVMLLIVTIASYLLAGIRASQRTGRVRTGVLAGLIVGLISFLFVAINILTSIFVFDTHSTVGSHKRLQSMFSSLSLRTLSASW